MTARAKGWLLALSVSLALWSIIFSAGSAFAAELCADVIKPPVQFAIFKSPPKTVTVRYANDAQMIAACGGLLKGNTGKVLCGCFRGSPALFGEILINANASPIGQSRTLVHETAHAWGWSGNHSGGGGW